MKIRYILLLLMLIPTSVASYAQENVLMSRINAIGPVQMSYTLTVDDESGQTVTDQNGTLYYQDGSYKLVSENMSIYCDGKSRWIYTVNTEEVVIDKNDYNSSNPSDNPLLLLASSNVKDTGNGTYRVIYTDSNNYKYIVKISALRQSEHNSQEFFILDESSLGEDVIVTDLR